MWPTPLLATCSTPRRARCKELAFSALRRYARDHNLRLVDVAECIIRAG